MKKAVKKIDKKCKKKKRKMKAKTKENILIGVLSVGVVLTVIGISTYNKNVIDKKNTTKVVDVASSQSANKSDEFKNNEIKTELVQELVKEEPKKEETPTPIEQPKPQEVKQTQPKQEELKGFKSSDFLNSQQVLTVTNTSMGSKYAKVNAYENVHGQWKVVYSDMNALIGKNGMVYDKDRKQSTMTTPAGVYSMPFAFGLNSAPSGTKIEYRKLKGNEYWNLNSGSSTYNRWVTSNPGGDNEHLADQTTQYKYAIVLDYNWNQVAGKGGAIFLHVKPSSYTAGCIGVAESDMVNILKWLDPSKNPKILICPQSDLNKYYY